MKDFGFVLCNKAEDGVYVNTLASFEDDRLFITGEDSGKILEKYFGSEVLKYWYTFEKEDTKKLLETIHGVEDPKKALIENFGDVYGTMKLEKLCKEKGINRAYDCIA